MCLRGNKNTRRAVEYFVYHTAISNILNNTRETRLVKTFKGSKTLERAYPQITPSSLGYTQVFKKSLQASQRCSNNLHITDHNGGGGQSYLLLLGNGIGLQLLVLTINHKIRSFFNFPFSR